MKRRILLVDDDLAVLLTLKAVLEFHGFEVETAASSAEAFARMESSVYHMVISDLRMETEEAGLEVLRTARRQAYNPATALLTAYPPSGQHWRGERRNEELRNEELRKGEHRNGEHRNGEHRNGEPVGGEDWNGETSDSLLIKPLGTGDLLRQVEALLIGHADKQRRQHNAAARAQEPRRQAG